MTTDYIQKNVSTFGLTAPHSQKPTFVSQVYIYFLLETKDVFIKIQKNKRRMRSLSHNYKKSDQNMIELCYYTRSLYKRFRLRHNLKRFHPLKFLLGTSQ